MHVPCDQAEPAYASAAKFKNPLAILLDAATYAHETGSDRWEFAVEINQIRRLGLCENDLRFLVRMGFVDHAAEVTCFGNFGRQFRPSGDLYFTNTTCFVLTRMGFARAASIVNTAAQKEPTFLLISRSIEPRQAIPQHVPTWDAERHILTFGGCIVKQFKWHAANQETVLSVFQEEGWPTRIDDPLAPMPTLDIKRRLSDTIKCLNRMALSHCLLRAG